MTLEEEVTELVTAIIELCEKKNLTILIAEDMTDAISDGFSKDKYSHKVLSSGGVVWIETK